MNEPVDLAAERLRRTPQYDGKVCECGSAWFRTRVVFNEHGYINGFAVQDVTCAQCGAPAAWRVADGGVV